jgi:hypothetical protein
MAKYTLTLTDEAGKTVGTRVFNWDFDDQRAELVSLGRKAWELYADASHAQGKWQRWPVPYWRPHQVILGMPEKPLV